MKLYFFIITLGLSMLLGVSCSRKNLTEGRILKNFQLIDLKSDKVKQGLVVIIQGDFILDILPEEDLNDQYRYPDSLVIDGQKKYLMPALQDMHVHLQASNSHFKTYLKHFLGYGITQVRVMAGDQSLLAWKDSIRSKQFPGPELKVAGPLIDGKEPLWGTYHNGPVVTDTATVNRIVLDQKREGYDLVKLYSRLSDEVYSEFLERAQAHGMPVAAHIPFSHLASPDPERTFNENSPSFEHFSNIGAFVTKEEVDSVSQPEDHGYYGYRLAEQPDPGKIKKIVRRIGAKNIWICPTSVLWSHSADSLLMEELKESEAFVRLDKGLTQWWVSSMEVKERDRHSAHLMSLLIREMADQNVPVLAGTDFPNPFLIPGLSLHQEIHNLAHHGYSNLEALKAATVYPALYWNDQKRSGYLEKGREADLLILSGSPLKDITQTTSIENVISDGQIWNPHVLREAAR